MQLAKKAAKPNKQKTLYGDTIVEAILAISIYSIVAVLALSSMSSGLSTAQRNLESTMSRAAIDSQSDTLRYFYESYVATKSGKSDDAEYLGIWDKIKPANDNIYDPYGLGKNTDDPAEVEKKTCDDLMSADNDLVKNKSSNKKTIFALSGRGALSERETAESGPVYGLGAIDANSYLSYQVIGADRIVSAPLYPRIIYKNMDSLDSTKDNDDAMSILSGQGDDDKKQSRLAKQAEGVWIFPKLNKRGDSVVSYDFFVRTCWNPVGSKKPSTFTSVVRLYNAD